jgi:hypothetical protein
MPESIMRDAGSIMESTFDVDFIVLKRQEQRCNILSSITRWKTKSYKGLTDFHSSLKKGQALDGCPLEATIVNYHWKMRRSSVMAIAKTTIDDDHRQCLEKFTAKD